MSRRREVVLYADGGVIERNPSHLGGTFAFVLVMDGEKITEASGVYTPLEMGVPLVTNNQMELLAVVKGLQEANRLGLRVSKVYSDSQITLGRVFQDWRLKNIPDWLVDELDGLDVTGIRGVFVRGHNGNKWNEYCDWLAEQAGRNQQLI